MPTINLKEHYPTAYTSDFLVEVSEEIHQLLVELKNEEDAFMRKINRYHVRQSLDDPDFFAEPYLLSPVPAPAEIIERQQHLLDINHAILALPPKQAKRCYDYYYCGISMPLIAESEGVAVGSISECIKSALCTLRERCNLFNS